MIKSASLFVACTVLVISTQNASQAAVYGTARFAFNPGWFSAASSSWNTVTDYEASSFSMGVKEFKVTSSTTYRGLSSSFVRHMWLTSNGSENYLTTMTYTDGTTSQDSTAFFFTPEKRDYDCALLDEDGNPTWHGILTSFTKFWLKHQVDHWPTSSANLSPGSGQAQVHWIFNRMPGDCDGSWDYDQDTITNHTYQKSNTVNGIELPETNIELITDPLGGKNL